MKLILTRKLYIDSGIFGEVCDSKNRFLFVSIERQYSDLNSKSGFKSKIPPGNYRCVRGKHRLADLVEFETFEIMGVNNHWGLLFHSANYNHELEGCIGLGLGFGKRSDGGKMITHSRKAFKEFLEIQLYCDEFFLTIE